MLSTEVSTERIVREDFSPDDDFFARPRESFGDSSVVLRIGPLGMCLEGLSRVQADQLARRFRPFVVEATVRPDVLIRVRRAGVRNFLALRRDGCAETYRLESRKSGDRTILWSYEFAGCFHPAAARADLALVDETGERFDRGLENFLRVLTANTILQRGGLLLHASGIVRRGKAHLFFGPSGRGKTTVTHLSPDDVVLSDDLSLVVWHAGRFEATGIPFGMAHHRTPDTRDSFPIASLNGLVQSKEVRREPLSGARALAEIVASLPFVMQEPAQSERALEVAGCLLKNVPVYRMWFRKDPTFWMVIEGAAE